jgi:hypothetical protein
MGTSLIRTPPPVGPYSSPIPKDLGDPRGVGVSDEQGTPVMHACLHQKHLGHTSYSVAFVIFVVSFVGVVIFSSHFRL